MKIFASLVLIGVSTMAQSQTYIVDQKDLAFSESQLTVKVNDVVNFVNQDDSFHNVYSLSDAAFFDLGSYGKGIGKEVEFDEPGEILVECAIHPDMKMTILVEE